MPAALLSVAAHGLAAAIDCPGLDGQGLMPQRGAIRIPPSRRTLSPLK